jgi:methionine--tRNA ligase beta chain
MDLINFNEFKKLDIRVGTIIEVKKVEGANKLLCLKVNLGNEERQIVAGIYEFYPNFQELVGKQVPILANLEPQIIRGLESQGMVLAVDSNSSAVLLHPEKKVIEGSAIR